MMASDSNVLTSDLGDFNFEEMNKSITENSHILDNLVDKIVSSYCKELDEYVSYIKKLLDNQDEPIQDIELEDFTLTLPTLLYFISDAQETLGIMEDVSKAFEKDKYNDVLSRSSGTVADKKALAELHTQNESLMRIVYGRAYKKIKLRYDSAYELLQSVKKVLNRRIAELELSRSYSGANRASNSL